MNQPLRILYIDDYPLDRELVRDALEKEHGGFELVETGSRADFEAALAQGGIDLVLSDFNILGFEGLQVLDTVHAKYPRLPVILVTGTGSEEIAVEAFKRGAADYVIKTTVHIQRLPHTILAVLEKKQLEDQRQQAIDALRFSEQTSQRTSEQLQIVNQIGLKITAGLDFEHLMQTIYEQCQQIGATDTFYIALYDEAAGILSFPFNYKDGKRSTFAARNIRENPGLLGYIIEHRQTLYLPDLSNLPAGHTQVRQPGAPNKSFVGVPLILNDRIVGVLSMQSHTLDAYTLEQIHTVELIATQVAIAIQNSQLYEQIQGERNLANALIDNLPGGVGLVSQEGHLVRWNKYVENMLDCSSEEIKRLDILSMFPEEEQTRLTDLFQRVFTGETMSTDTLLIAKQSEQKIPIYATGTRVQIGNEAFLLLIGIGITERKRAEEEIRMLNAELEKRVDERTRELREAQEKLVRQERLAVLGQLAGGVGHELRNPLGVIANAIYFLKLIHPNADEKTQEYYGIIENETRTAEKIINDLLDYSRIKSIDSEVVTVSELFQRVLEHYPAPEPVTVLVKIPARLPPVFVDPRQMLQVLGNLVVNAYQAMPEGGELTLSAKKKGKMVEISIQDTGIGILPENMDKLFEPLFTTKLHGIGLGLAVCKKLVEANNGRIEVDSTPGDGATFCMVLPVFKEEL